MLFPFSITPGMSAGLILLGWFPSEDIAARPCDEDADEDKEDEEFL